MALFITQIVTFCFNLYIAFSESKKNIIFANFLFNMGNLLTYYILEDATSQFAYMIITVRSIVYLFVPVLKKLIWIPWFFITLHIILGLYSMVNIWQVFSLVAPCVICYVLWFCEDIQKIRLGNIINNGLWFIYNIINGLWILSIGRCITILINVISIKTFRKKEE